MLISIANGLIITGFVYMINTNNKQFLYEVNKDFYIKLACFASVSSYLVVKIANNQTTSYVDPTANSNVIVDINKILKSNNNDNNQINNDIEMTTI